MCRHRGDSAQYANRSDAIAQLVRRLQAGPGVTRIAIEPTGGYEKPLVAALRQAKLPVELVHTSRFKGYRTMVGVKAKSDTSDARLLAAYAAAPDDVRGRKADRAELPQDATREELRDLASRRDQLKHMIHAESCRLAITRHAALRQSILAHLEALRAEDKQVLQMMRTLVRQRLDLRRDQKLLQTIKGLGIVSVLTLIAAVPELGRLGNKQAAALVALRRSCTKRHSDTLPGSTEAVLPYAAFSLHGGRHRQPVQSRSEILHERHRQASQPSLLWSLMRRLVVFANAVLRSGQLKGAVPA